MSFRIHLLEGILNVVKQNEGWDGGKKWSITKYWETLSCLYVHKLVKIVLRKVDSVTASKSRGAL